MQQDAIRAAAELLWRSWQSGQRIIGLPTDCRPEFLQDGYVIQAALAQCADQSVVGWKIAATSTAGQAHIGVDGPIAGRLLADKVHQFDTQPVTLSLTGNAMRVAEAEFAFRLGADLPPRTQAYTQEDVMACVESLHPAIEIPDSRFAEFATVGGAQLAADNACAREFILGTAVSVDWRSIDLVTHGVSMHINGKPVTQGQGRDVLGDPRIALTWLANCEALQGIGLRAGQIVTTGVCGQPSAIKSGDQVVADFGIFGQVAVGF